MKPNTVNLINEDNYLINEDNYLINEDNYLGNGYQYSYHMDDAH